MFIFLAWKSFASANESIGDQRSEDQLLMDVDIFFLNLDWFPHHRILFLDLIIA